MLVLFKNAKVDGRGLDLAIPTEDIVIVVGDKAGSVVQYDDGPEPAHIIINLPIEQVVGLINQAMGAVAIPDAPEKSVVVITGKDVK